MTTPEPLLVQAIYSFKGKNNDELCFKKGDVIVVTQKEDGGWWEGTFNEKTGWFPSNYVQEYTPSSDALNSPVKFSSPVKLPSDLALNMKANRALVVKDIIDSEKAYVTELQNLIHNFLVPIEKSEIMSKEQFKQLTSNLLDIVSLHETLLATLEASQQDQRLGRVFLQFAPDIKRVHYAYAHSHPRAACILDTFKDELTKVMESSGASSPGLLVLTTGLSKPLRRLDKYTGLLQELERHVDEAHIDRGDSQRCVSVYRDITAACAMVRRQKELELEVLTGGVRGWEGEELSHLGEVLHMGSVAVGTNHQDRYFVLFPSTLLMLSVSSRMSAFIYEGKLPLTGIVVSRLDDCEAYKNAFQISGPLIDTILAICQTRDDLNLWIDKLSTQIRHNRTPGGVPTPLAPSRPAPPPHHPCLKNRQSDTSSINTELPWTLTHLRPAPPLHPSFCRNEKLKPYKCNERSYDEDAQILKVIEAYCSTSSQFRHTLNSA
uniref:Rho guanine nucleotide exchange factor 7 n=1 Tax=Cacopsylla melanoneura TaxID=428564 RepID=A0A8D8TQA5_9HEMI